MLPLLTQQSDSSSCTSFCSLYWKSKENEAARKCGVEENVGLEWQSLYRRDLQTMARGPDLVFGESFPCCDNSIALLLVMCCPERCSRQSHLWSLSPASCSPGFRERQDSLECLSLSVIDITSSSMMKQSELVGTRKAFPKCRGLQFDDVCSSSPLYSFTLPLLCYSGFWI